MVCRHIYVAIAVCTTALAVNGTCDVLPQIHSRACSLYASITITTPTDRDLPHLTTDPITSLYAPTDYLSVLFSTNKSSLYKSTQHLSFLLNIKWEAQKYGDSTEFFRYIEPTENGKSTPGEEIYSIILPKTGLTGLDNALLEPNSSGKLGFLARNFIGRRSINSQSQNQILRMRKFEFPNWVLKAQLWWA